MKKVLTTPISNKDIEDLNVGDIIYVSGHIVTGRDDVYRRIVHENYESPYDFNGGVIFHAGPIVKESPEKNEMISIGPTSSIRMEDDSKEFIKKTGVKIMIGKGGTGDNTSAACKEYKAIHCVFPGGCAVLAASKVEEIETVYWRELGMPECMWVCRVNEFGPLIVSVDTKGRNLFSENQEYYKSKKEEAMSPIIDYVKDFQKI